MNFFQTAVAKILVYFHAPSAAVTMVMILPADNGVKRVTKESVLAKNICQGTNNN
jgi:hypothetical protein